MQKRASIDPNQQLLVVENSGVTRVSTTRESGGVPSEVIYQPQIGIPFARNAVLDWAQSRNFEWIAFLDDDTVPNEKWLDDMIFALMNQNYDAIQGSWKFSYDEGYPKFLPRMSSSSWTGIEALRTASTRNVIFSTKKVFELRTRFDQDLSEFGGSDTEFFMQLVNAGFKIGTTSRGLVDERIVGNRATASWHLRRKIREDQTWFSAARKFGRAPLGQEPQTQNPKTRTFSVLRKVFSFSSFYVTNRKGVNFRIPQLVVLPLTSISWILLRLGIRIREYQTPKPRPLLKYSKASRVWLVTKNRRL
jgi:succinoglycan biosynthesis protein ExoM